VQDVDEDGTELLKAGMEKMWRKINPQDPRFALYPFGKMRRVGRLRNKKGRFI